MEEQASPSAGQPSGIFTAPAGAGGAASAVKDYSERQAATFLCFMAVSSGFGPPGRSQAAARIALDTVDELLDPGRFEGTDEFRAAASRVLEAAFDKANSRLLETDEGGEQVSGATLTCVAADGESAFIGHVGNARAYLLTGRGLRQLTSDHVEYLEAARTRLTRALGIADEVETDILRVPLKAGEVLLICSQGIYSALEDGEIVAALSGGDLPAACRWLAETASARGAGGDLTVAAWCVPGEPVAAIGTAGPGTDTQANGRPRRRRWLVALVALLLIAAGAAAGWGIASIWFKSKPAVKKTTAAPATKARYVQGDVLQISVGGKAEGCYLADYPGGPDQVRLYDGWKVRVLSTVYQKGARWYRIEVTEGPAAGQEGYVKESFLVKGG